MSAAHENIGGGGRGGGGRGGRGGGGRGGHGRHHHHHGGRGGRPWRWAGGPILYDVGIPYSTGIEIDDLIDEAEQQAQKEELAQEIVRQLNKGRAVVGGDLELLDTDAVGLDLDFGSILQTAGNLAQGGINLYEKEEAKKKAEEGKAKSAAEEQRRLAAAIAADATATQAAARAALTAKAKLPSAPIDASAAAQAAAAQARAGAGLSPESLEKRLDAATKALAAATAKAQANPKDGQAVALMDAWQATMNKISNAGIVSGAAPVVVTESFWHRLLRWLGLE